jgi:hypothetical protein
MTSATAAMLGSASFQAATRAPCRVGRINPSIGRANRDEQNRPRHRSCSHRHALLPQLGGCVFRGIVLRIAVSRSWEKLPWLRHRRERAEPSISVQPDSSCGSGCLGKPWEALKLELDQRERRTVGHCLLARRSRLIETIGDTTRTAASRRIGSRELELVESVLRKLRLFDHTHYQPKIDAD